MTDERRNLYDGHPEVRRVIITERDPILENALKLWDSGNRDAWNKLPLDVRSRADIYRDLGPGPDAA